MTNLTEQSQWESGVFQIETITPVLGGQPGFDAGVPVTGHSNAQAQQLANRTKWLNDNKVGSSALSANSGSTLVGFKSSTVYKKLSEWINLTDYSTFTGNGVADDTPAFTSAIADCISENKGFYCPPGYSIKLTNSSNMKGIRNIVIESDIVITSGTLTVGGNVNVGKFDINLQAVTNGTCTSTSTPPASPVVRVTGITASEVTIGACNYIQLFADASVTSDRFVAYNQFKLTGTVSLLEITDSGTALSYVNENFIYADRIIRYRVIGVGYGHNHNKLFHPCMEGTDVSVTFSGNGVSTNQVYGVRFEGASTSPGVTFGAGTYSNTVIFSWSGVGNPRGQFFVNIPVSDSGQGNIVTSEASHIFRKTTLFSVGSGSIVVGNSADCVVEDSRIAPVNPGIDNFTNRVVLTPGIYGVVPSNSNRYVAISDIVPVKLGDVIVWDTDFDGSIARTAVFVYDENMNPLLSEGTGGAFVRKVSYSFNSAYGRYSETANISASHLAVSPCSVLRNEVKFIRVAFYLGTVGLIRSFSASLYTQALGRGNSEDAASIRNVMRVLDGTPTRGYALP
jgi:hypothetical protein